MVLNTSFVRLLFFPLAIVSVRDLSPEWPFSESLLFSLDVKGLLPDVDDGT